LEYCAETGKAPDKPYSGKFNVRLDPSLHRQVAMAAKSNGTSINTFVAESLRRAMQTH
jgi:predicted HicB family RNase H-like nuclease